MSKKKGRGRAKTLRSNPKKKGERTKYYIGGGRM